MTSLASHLSELRRGQMLDRYELIYPVAEGGMASVWLARLRGKHGFEKQVAIKTILPSFAEDKRFRRMLLDEARIASRIEHVNVAQTLDLGEHEGHLYLVMEWVEGDSLSKLGRALDRSGLSLPLPILLRVIVEACAGLHAAHELCDEHGARLGVVHRDVSPQNILVSVKGQTKLIDFGIAKAQSAPSEETRAGILKGKLYYMPPEQALRKPVDRRADVWAIGAVLYRMLSGRTPYESKSPVSSLKLLTSRTPPPPLPTTVDARLAELILRALSPHPAERPDTALQLQEELESLATGLGGLATSQELASFVTTHLGQTLQERRDRISMALRSVEEVPTAVQPVSSKRPTPKRQSAEADTTPNRRIDPETGVFSPSASSSAVTLHMASQPPSPPSRSKWPLVGAGAALAGLSLWALSGSSASSGSTATPSVASSKPVAVVPTPSSAPAALPPVVSPASLPESPNESVSLPPPVQPSTLPLAQPKPAPPPVKVPAKRPPTKATTAPAAKVAAVPKRKAVDDGF